jgi:hypothetical protein
MSPSGSPSDQTGWNDGNWLFPRALRLLEVPEYRNTVLLGIIVSIGSKTDSTVRFSFIRAMSFIHFVFAAKTSGQ